MTKKWPSYRWYESITNYFLLLLNIRKNWWISEMVQVQVHKTGKDASNVHHPIILLFSLLRRRAFCACMSIIVCFLLFSTFLSHFSLNNITSQPWECLSWRMEIEIIGERTSWVVIQEYMKVLLCRLVEHRHHPSQLVQWSRWVQSYEVSGSHSLYDALIVTRCFVVANELRPNHRCGTHSDCWRDQGAEQCFATVKDDCGG